MAASAGVAQVGLAHWFAPHAPAGRRADWSAAGTQIAPSHGVWTPFAGTFVSPGVSYLFERRNKRGLRYEAAKQGTAIGVAQQSDSERNLLFNLRSAFVGVLQAKAVLRLAQDNLDSYDKILKVRAF